LESNACLFLTFPCSAHFACIENCLLIPQALDHAKERGAKIYAEVRGYGMSGTLLFLNEDCFCHLYVSDYEAQFVPGDAHHITQPQNGGRGAILAIKRALDQVQSPMRLCCFMLHILVVLFFVKEIRNSMTVSLICVPIFFPVRSSCK